MKSSYIGQAIIAEDSDSIVITIPSKGVSAFFTAFAGLWLCLWCVIGLIVLVMQFINGPFAKAIIVFPVWAIIGSCIFRFLYWHISGMEIIIIERGKLTLDRKAALFFKTKEYNLYQARNFQARDTATLYQSYRDQQRNLLNLGRQGVIAFSYGSETVTFGLNMDKAEGELVIKKLRDARLLTDENF